MISAEQEARDLLERMGVADAQSFTAGDVVELANLIAHRRTPIPREDPMSPTRKYPTPRLKVYRDRKGDWRWRLIATNGRILADCGQGYTRRTDAVNGAYLTEYALQASTVIDRHGRTTYDPRSGI